MLVVYQHAWRQYASHRKHQNIKLEDVRSLHDEACMNLGISAYTTLPRNASKPLLHLTYDHSSPRNSRRDRQFGQLAQTVSSLDSHRQLTREMGIPKTAIDRVPEP